MTLMWRQWIVMMVNLCTFTRKKSKAGESQPRAAAQNEELVNTAPLFLLEGGGDTGPLSLSFRTNIKQ
jgi:hypothetical protein